MNLLEQKMLAVLKSLRDDYGVIGIKAEFEAEGTRIDELMRLIEIVRKLNLKLGIKIGGCEAMKDLMECKQFGTEYIIAPMVETDYALKKFIEAKNKIFDEEEKKVTEFLINIETKTTTDNIEKIVSVNNLYNSSDRINGWVFGRVDYTMSQGMNRDDINSSEKITNSVIEVAKHAKKNDLNLVVGGAVSIDAVSILKEVKKVHLDRFETRKVIFSSDALEVNDLSKGMLEAINFELLWLKNKKNYYGSIFEEDDKRIKMLSARWEV
ncbi:aldolase/citrate lyase family protein [Candidatus Pelagibacter sp. Uisw_136]|uniref:aldolase/citrate lyase family protein n=1 Tax=Candidatus Pelagibacter sp. Uisw_136 TaxID=3230991 RepID=UPI0039E9AFCB